MIFREYDPTRDKLATNRIWQEIGWLDKEEEENGKKAERMDRYVADCRALVAEMDGEAECLVLSQPGTIRYQTEDLPLSVVAGVTTSIVARKQGIAGRLTAKLVATDAAEGAYVSTLGIFDQGFYNNLGFGNGAYEISVAFEPSQLLIEKRARPPKRLTKKDTEAIHNARLKRRLVHGGCNIKPLAATELESSEKGFGLGYFDGPNGELTHCMWLDTSDIGRGPYHVYLCIFQTREQFLELMALLKNMSDQVYLIKMQEPPGIQMQDLLRQPFKQRALTEKSKFETHLRAHAYWQMRICDLEKCLAKTHLSGQDVTFNLKLTDPITRLLSEDERWRGIGGDYLVTLGPNSHAEKGTNSSLPTLSASVNAFTRLWLGIRPATGLAMTDDLSGPPELLEQLDEIVRLPVPKPDWDY